MAVAAKAVEVGEERRDVEQRRQEQHEHELRVELDIRHAGHEPDAEAAEDEQDRVRHAEPAREHAEGGDGRQQPEQEHLDVTHPSSDCRRASVGAILGV